MGGQSGPHNGWVLYAKEDLGIYRYYLEWGEGTPPILGLIQSSLLDICEKIQLYRQHLSMWGIKILDTNISFVKYGSCNNQALCFN